jgi:putative flippase GtrA
MSYTRVSMLAAIKQRWHRPAAELIGYAMATGVAFAIDIGLLTILASYVGLHYVASAVLAFAVASVVMYLLSVRFVFRYRRVANPTRELSYFIGIGVLVLGFQTAVMAAAVELFHVHYLAGKLGAAGCTFFANFLIRRTVLFTPPSPDRGLS